jgi:hypothetical protein
MDRRKLLIGAAATLATAATSAPAGTWNLDALVMGIRYQSWPWEEEEGVWKGARLSGVIEFADESDLRPLSWFKPLIADYERIFGGPLWFRPIPLVVQSYIDGRGVAVAAGGAIVAEVPALLPGEFFMTVRASGISVGDVVTITGVGPERIHRVIKVDGDLATLDWIWGRCFA